MIYIKKKNLFYSYLLIEHMFWISVRIASAILTISKIDVAWSFNAIFLHNISLTITSWAKVPWHSNCHYNKFCRCIESRYKEGSLYYNLGPNYQLNLYKWPTNALMYSFRIYKWNFKLVNVHHDNTNHCFSLKKKQQQKNKKKKTKKKQRRLYSLPKNPTLEWYKFRATMCTV